MTVFRLLSILIAVSIMGFAQPVFTAEELSSIARGGRLYDKWFKVVKVETPTTPHPAYPKDGKYYGKKGSDWRCKECHGWDYQGKDGAYSKGKHFSGIKGIRDMAGAEPDKIIAVLKDDTHGYTDEMRFPGRGAVREQRTDGHGRIHRPGHQEVER